MHAHDADAGHLVQSSGKSMIDLTFLTAVESSEQIAFFLSFFVFLRESIAKATHTA